MSMKSQGKYTTERMLKSAKIASEALLPDITLSGNAFKIIELQACPDMLSHAVERNAELLEAVKKAHEILLHEMDNGRTPSMLQGVGLGYFEDVIAGID